MSFTNWFDWGKLFWNVAHDCNQHTAPLMATGGVTDCLFFLMTSKSRVILQILLAGCRATWHQAPLLNCIRVEGRKLVCRPHPGSLTGWAIICGHVICVRMSVWLGISPLACMEGQSEKQFKEKSENVAHNSSVILFAVDRWEENPIRLDGGEYPLPSQCANRQTHTFTFFFFILTTKLLTHTFTQRHVHWFK